MISRRDKLLVRPWEERRFEYHRRKVQSAIPAIDNNPPANRFHVSYKLKKHQKEIERCDKIERDNLKLLQRLRSVMTSSRVDNTWITAQPNFLNKVAIYDSNNKLFYKEKKSPSVSFEEDKTRKGRCMACTPKKMDSPKIPEERIPWEPPKPPVSLRSQSLPPSRLQSSKSTPSRQSSTSSKTKTPVRASSSITSKQSKPSKPQSPATPAPLRSRSRSVTKRTSASPPQYGGHIMLSRGEMHLEVSFPPDTTIRMKNGVREMLQGGKGLCQCKALRAQ